MSKKSFTAFCTDTGIMRMVPAIDYSRCEVIPAGGHERSGYKKAAARLERVCQDALISAKLDRLTELMGRITAERNRPIPDAPGAGPSVSELMARYQPSAGEMAAQYRARNWAKICADAEAAYAARNPHKKGEEYDLQ